MSPHDAESRLFRLLSLSRLKGVGKVTLNKIVSSGQIDLKIEDVCKNILKKSYTDAELKVAQDFADSQLSSSQKLAHTIVPIWDSRYPVNLKATRDSPPFLYCAGSVEVLNTSSVAVIGTREPTKAGIEIARRITSFLCENDWNIVSGLAIGVDTIAHLTALEKNAKTTCVMAHGLDSVYPKQNQQTFEQILDSGGCAVSEYSYGTTVRSQFLVQRDYIQAGLSAAVVLIQSDHVGGSLHASRRILKYNRPLVVAGQSSVDISNDEPKIHANLTLLGESTSEKEKLLKCAPIPSDLLFKLKSKNDYSALCELLKSINTQIHQTTLNQNDFLL